MRFLAIAALLLASSSGVVAARESQPPAGKVDAKRCRPKAVSRMVSRARQSESCRMQVRKGEKSTGYSPIVAFKILESGEVADAFIKRSSGIADVDNCALTSIRETKFRNRPGCGVLDTEADVTIDWR